MIENNNIKKVPTQKSTTLEYWEEEYNSINDLKSSELIFSLRKIFFPNPLWHRVLLFCNKQFKKNRNKSILEAGCGWGDIVVVLAENGYSVIGADHSKNAVKMAKKRINEKKLINAQILHSDINDATIFNGGQFDLIINLGVLEHYENPEKLLNSLSSLLKLNGFLFISVPNTNSFMRTKSRKEFVMKTEGYHRWYTLIELTNLLNSQNFKILDSYTDDFAFGVSRWFVDYMWGKSFKNKYQILSNLIGCFLYWVFFPFNFFPYFSNKGQNTICVLQKVKEGKGYYK